MMISTAYAAHFDAHHDARALTGSAVIAPARALLASTLITASFVSAVASLYLVKSALGINLLAGHSPLHGLLYHLVR